VLVCVLCFVWLHLVSCVLFGFILCLVFSLPSSCVLCFVWLHPVSCALFGFILCLMLCLASSCVLFGFILCLVFCLASSCVLCFVWLHPVSCVLFGFILWLVCPMLPDSLECPFLTANSGFSNFNYQYYKHEKGKNNHGGYVCFVIFKNKLR